MKFRDTVIALILLALAAGGYFAMRAVLKTDGPETINLFGPGRSREDVVGLGVETSKTYVQVVFTNGRYWILNKKTDEYSIPAKQEQIEQFFSGLGAVTLIEKIPLGGREPGEWDLDKKASRLFLKYPDGVQREVFIGADNPAGRGVFIRLGDDPEHIYLVSIQVRLAAEGVLFNLTDSRILLARAEDFQSFEIDAVAREKWRANAVTCTLMADQTWKVERPIQHAADSETVRSYLDIISKLEFESREDHLFKAVAELPPLLAFRARLKGDEKEELEFYGGKSDIMDQSRYILLNRRTGLIGYVYAPVFHTINRSFVSFIWRRLFQGNPDDIARIDLKRGDRNLTFIHPVAGAWTVSEHFDAPVEANIMKRILGMINNFRISEYVSSNVNDLDKYGLKHPLAVLTIEEYESETSQSYCFYFGKHVEGKNEVYFKEAAANEIYTVKYDFLRMLSRPPETYVDRGIVSFKKEQADLVKITMPGRSYRFYREEEEGWILREPLLTRHIDDKRFDELLDTLGALNYEDVPVPERVPMEAFDDKNVIVRLELHIKAPRDIDVSRSVVPLKDQDVYILLSRLKDAAGNLYARRKFTNLTFTVKPRLGQLLTREYVDRSAFIDDISGCSALTVEYLKAETVIRAQRKGGGWELIAPEGRAVDDKALVAYVEYLNELKGDQVFLYRSSPEDRAQVGFKTPLLRITVETGAGVKHTLTLSDHLDEAGNGLLRPRAEVYLLRISPIKLNRLRVAPDYFYLD